MEYKFYCQGHELIQSSHHTTVEITKDTHLTIKGDCIIGVNADFDLHEIKKLLQAEKIKMTIKCGDATDEILFVPNKTFDSNHEIVIRRTDFASERTLGIKSNKASKDLNKELIIALKKGERAEVIMETYTTYI